MKYINFVIVALVIVLSSCQGSKEDKIFAIFETDKGNIKIELFYKAAPMTVANFVGLAEGTIENTAKGKGVPYFDGLTFHRVITKGNGDQEDFMIQGGDPDGTGQGGPGYQFPNEIVDSLTFDAPGMLAMANAGPNTNGSQFFITVAPTQQLFGGYSVFGKVVEGLEIVNKIKKDDKIIKVTIERQGAGGKAFDAKAVFESAKSDAKAKVKEAQQKEVAGFESFISQNFPTAQKTASGIYYQMETEGTGLQPTAENEVEVHYEGSFLDGKVFDSSYERGETVTFPLNRVIPGWTEGLQLFKEGGKGTLIIPYQLAYGEAGNQGIPPRSNLIFKVELIKVK